MIYLGMKGVAVIVGAATVVVGKPDRHIPAIPKRIAFGSCAKQDRDAESAAVWASVGKTSPDAWIWMGDAVYPKKHNATMEELEACYKKQKSRPDYSALIASVKTVDGTIDDHDYGLNDGGKSHIHKEQAKQLFLDFIGVPKNSPRRTRDGTYTSITFGEPPKQVKFVLLDTRYNRDDNWITKLGGLSFPASSVISAGIRWITAFIGIGAKYDGDMLGEPQWKWLESELQNSEAAAHFVVSSVQVTTSFQLVESWGRFPAAKRRLYELLKKTKPRGLVLLSGDVHFAQMLGYDDGVLEITSSGLTHSVAEFLSLWTFVERTMLPFQERYYEGRNFGVLDFTFKEHETAENGERPVIETIVIASIRNYLGTDVAKAALIFWSNEDPMERLRLLDIYPVTLPVRGRFSMFCRGTGVLMVGVWAAQLIYLLAARFVMILGKVRRREKRD